MRKVNSTAELNATEKNTMRAQVKKALIDLDTIINTDNPTQSQITWAIKRIAEIEKRELQFHNNEITSRND